MKEEDIAGSVKLLSYQIKEGKTLAECREILVQAGYNEADISVVMGRLKPQTQATPNQMKPTPQPKSPVQIQPKNNVPAQNNNALLIVGVIVIVLAILIGAVLFVLPIFNEQVEVQASQVLEDSKNQLNEIQVIIVDLYDGIISQGEISGSEIRETYQEDLLLMESAVTENDILYYDKRIFIEEIMLSNDLMVDDVRWLYSKEKASYEEGKNAKNVNELLTSMGYIINNEIFLGLVVLWNVIAITANFDMASGVEEEDPFLGFEHESFENRISEAENLLNKDLNVKSFCTALYSEDFYQKNEDMDSFEKIIGQAWFNSNKPKLIEECESLTTEYINLKKQQFRSSLSGDNVAEKIYYSELMFVIDEFISSSKSLQDVKSDLQQPV